MMIYDDDVHDEDDDDDGIDDDDNTDGHDDDDIYDGDDGDVNDDDKGVSSSFLYEYT